MTIDDTLMQSDLDVQLRRQWFVMPQADGTWIVCRLYSHHGYTMPVFLDGNFEAFTANHPLGLLTKADAAMKEKCT